jgi:hypothetical protein
MAQALYRSEVAAVRKEDRQVRIQFDEIKAQLSQLRHCSSHINVQ